MPGRLTWNTEKYAIMRRRGVEIMKFALKIHPADMWCYGAGLIQGATYVYLLQELGEYSRGTDACGGNFTTSPSSTGGGSARFWVIGDSGHPSQRQSAVLDAYLNYTEDHPADAVLALGDIAYDNGYDYEFDSSYFGPYRDLMSWIPFWSTIGNHETYNELTPYPYYDLLTLPTKGEAGGHASGTEAYYSFDYGQVHVICLESMNSVHQGWMEDMLTWLERDLASLATSKPKWLVAFFHHPPYSKASHDSDLELELIAMRRDVIFRLEAGGVDLVLSGHSHGYERSSLLRNFYGTSASWNPARHQMDGGSGNPWNGEVYTKETDGLGWKEGTVYVSWDHPAMVVSVKREAGSLVIDIEGPASANRWFHQ
eukprot:gene963-1479_t